MKKPDKMMGPVDYIVVLFPGNKFHGKIAPELSRPERSWIIRIIDLNFITKDVSGKVKTMEAKDLGGEAGEAFRAFSANVKDWLCLEDIEGHRRQTPREQLGSGAIIGAFMGR